MIPTPRLLVLGAALAVTALLPAFYPNSFKFWLLLPFALVLCMVYDFFCISGVKLEGRRNVRQVLSHRAWSDVTLNISNVANRAVHAQVHDMHPQLCQVRGLPRKQFLAAQNVTEFIYEVMPKVRGNMQFDGIDCLIRTKLGLWARKLQVPCHSDIKVFPNFKNNKLFGMLLSKRSLDHTGIRRLPRPGEGNDFHQLREYRDGDSLRQIDWKATARMQKIIAREYAQERDQQIVFLLDCSMRMRHQDAKASHMDETLNAVMLLSHVAIQQGDATGIMTFGGIDRWIPPAKGLVSARRLMNGLYDLDATKELPDYVQAVESLATRLKRRALVILITNLRNEDGQSALDALKRLRGKHMVLMADLRESDLDAAIKSEPTTTEEAVLWLSAEHYRLERKKQHRLAVAGGTKLLDVTPKNLSADLITRYLAIKRLGQL